ncbi:hypothetical protein DAPPUDRAFT_115826 [Daphnia pulex]|uniref:Uncharacterized protein n=1 Tax=Daphnia pulex TaxID=6669 RepID=E9HMN3_DAPPU|nr:hypothetical protein DAPPUDRAFT_115826 [Daphnia pulex]|eukprot:EFX67012.1 hypothetical protein DAPPUDRAFT_115826 [Daphnia pulex]
MAGIQYVSQHIATNAKKSTSAPKEEGEEPNGQPDQTLISNHCGYFALDISTSRASSSTRVFRRLRRLPSSQATQAAVNSQQVDAPFVATRATGQENRRTGI